MPRTKTPRIDSGDLTVGPNDTSLQQQDQPQHSGYSPQVDHAQWCAAQIAAGWSYGSAFSEADRTDPRLVAWEMLGEQGSSR